MTFSIPKNAFIVIADGEGATYYRNIASSGVEIEETGKLPAGAHDGRGAAPVPIETSPHEFEDATFAKHIADDLYHKVHKGGIEAIILVADPQTLGQIRPSLHKEVLNLISGELDKDLTNSSIKDIENSLTKAVL